MCPRRRPEQSPLYRAVQAHLETFLRASEAIDIGGLPGFVERELRGFLRCGVLAHGFLRVACPSCRHERLVAHSCGGRGFCPSCGGRRMNQGAANLVDHVLPAEVPYRQWVLSLPFDLRRLLGMNAELTSAVLRVMVRKVSALLRRQAKRHGIADPRPGAVAVIQRFDSALRLCLHFHVVVPDGVFHERDGMVHFQGLEPPTDAELLRLLATIVRGVHQGLERLGYESGASPEPHDAHGWHVAAATHGGTATGRPLPRLVLEPPEHTERPAPSLTATHAGYSLHAATTVAAHDSEALERLCRYLLRPPLVPDRLTELDDGRYAYTLRKRWRDGTAVVYFDPMTLMQRLAALVPRPHANLVRYYGVFAPNARLRPAVVPARTSPEPDHGEGDRADGANNEAPASRRSRYIAWAVLLRRVFGPTAWPLDCPACGTQMRVIAAILDGPTVRKILLHLGLPPTPPPVAAARDPPW